MLEVIVSFPCTVIDDNAFCLAFRFVKLFVQSHQVSISSSQFFIYFIDKKHMKSIQNQELTSFSLEEISHLFPLFVLSTIHIALYLRPVSSMLIFQLLLIFTNLRIFHLIRIGISITMRTAR